MERSNNELARCPDSIRQVDENINIAKRLSEIKTLQIEIVRLLGIWRRGNNVYIQHVDTSVYRINCRIGLNQNPEASTHSIRVC